MTAGTQQYISRNGTTTTMSGAADLTITNASDKVQLLSIQVGQGETSTS